MTPYPDVLVASDYVVCATLRKIADVFNVDLLWNRVRGGQEGVVLMEALKRYPRTLGDRQRQETRYSHVIVRIPERDYVRDDRLEDGFSRRALLQELRRRHEQEMGDYLAERSMIRYRLEPDPILRRARCSSCSVGRFICRPKAKSRLSGFRRRRRKRRLAGCGADLSWSATDVAERRSPRQ
jgi:hypothetical protein